ncbi:hypothetical protein [Microbacterium lacus]|uniref:hypothetical protein n=1 Tax=Microbacterium lacus TaxID=415217 RepID=UPI000C2B9CFA|nr:hypothetical protein [Microbacterium lacus]
MPGLLRADRMFQTLFTEIAAGIEIDSAPEGITVAADLDIGSFMEIPFLTHSSNYARDRNGPHLWTVTLSASIFLEPLGALDVVSAIDDGIWSWDYPLNGIVSGIGAVESIDEELSAFSRLGGEVQMKNKVVTQYVGSWQLTVQNR